MRKTSNIEAIYPLSPMQEGILFHALFTPQTMGYFEQSSSTLEGDLNVSAFERAWQTIVARHPILRTLFTWEKRDQPLQIVRQKVIVPFAYDDWRSYSSSEQQAQLEAFLVADRKQGFDLSKAPLMRLALMRLGERRYQFTWSFHHLLLDGWSGPIVWSEAIALYDAFCRAESPALPQRRPYRDYIVWLQQQDLSQTEQFWRTYLDGFTHPTPFGVDAPKSEGPDEAYATQEFVLPQAATEPLLQLAQQHHLTVSTLIQGVWAIILSRYSSQRVVIFGATVSGRTAPLADIENMVGLFINTLPLRVRVKPQLSLLEWLQYLQAQQTKLRLHEHSPLTHIHRCSGLPANVPLFESILVLANYPVPQPTGNSPPSLTIRKVQTFEQTNYPLTIQVTPGTKLTWRLTYDCYRFTSATISRMIGHIQTLLKAIVTDPNRPLGETPCLTEVERQQLLVDWNNTVLDYPRDKLLHAFFEDQVKKTPDAIAVAYQKEQITYAELNTRANQLAHYLKEMGVGPQVVVGLCTNRSIEMVSGLLAILKAGGIYLPLDPMNPTDRLLFMLEDSRALILLTEKRIASVLPKSDAQAVYLDSDDGTFAQFNTENPMNSVSAETPAYLIYTSGSTGRPKGVICLHHGAMNRFNWMWNTYPFEAKEVCCQKTSISFVDSIWEILGPLLKGIKSVIISDEVVKEPKRFIQSLAVEKVTRLITVPSYLRVILNTYPDLQERLPKLKFWISSGEILPKALCERFHSKLPQSVLLNLYGSSEVSADVTCYDTNLLSPKHRSVPIGRPIANTQVYILDFNLQPVPIGVTGELYIGGENLAAGYLNLNEITEKTFIANPFSDKPDARLYKTGDKGRWLSDGTIEFLGRVDHQVKIRGYRIELGEVEAALNKHPKVGSSVVVAREEQTDDKQLVAYVILGQTPNVTNKNLRRFLRQRLPDYMIPSTFVTIDALPLTPSGKVDRKALPAPDRVQSEAAQAYVGPQDEIELQLTKIWEKVLSVKNIGIKDNFFDLGGHSLLAVRLFALIQKIFNKELPLATLFQAPTIEELTDIIRKKKWASPWSSLVPIQPNGSKPPFFCVHGCGGRILHFYDLARHLGPEIPFYGLRGQGLEKGETFHTKIEDMAAFYIKEIQTIQPEGPYFMGGNGDGGAIVLEMAQQLKLQGHDVAFLAIMDPVTPRPSLVYFNHSRQIFGGSFNHFYHRLVGFMQHRPLMPAMKHAFFNRVLIRWKITQRFVPASTHRQHRFRDATRSALLNYTAQLYPGRITCFLREDTFAIRQERLGDWCQIAAGGLDVRLIPGGLLSMWRKPYVQVLAERLNACIDEAHLSN